MSELPTLGIAVLVEMCDSQHHGLKTTAWLTRINDQLTWINCWDDARMDFDDVCSWSSLPRKAAGEEVDDE